MKKRVAKLEGQLGERNFLFAKTTQEHDRLRLAEAELKRNAGQLTSELSSLKTAHQAKLNRLLEARMTVEELLQQEHNKAVRKLEAAIEAHQQALVAARKKVEVALTCMHEMDDLITGKIS